MLFSPEQALFLDLELSSDGKRLLDIGAIMGSGELRAKKLAELKPWIARARHIVGHNLIRHDVPFLRSKIGNEPFEGKNLVDTLGWSALLYADKPYHKLVKGYKLENEDTANNPLSDSKLCKQLFDELLGKFLGLPPSMKALYWSLLRDHAGYGGFFRLAGYAASDQGQDAVSVINEQLAGQYCSQADVSKMASEHPVELAHALALVTTAEEASILPPWVVHALPIAQDLLHRLRFTYCGKPTCTYCTAKLDPVKALKAHYGYTAFRRFDGDEGIGIQERAVRAALKGRSLLTVFPTGGGKSLTFQLPALMQGELTRSLTVVISPLVSLMKDQVEVLEDRFQNVQAAHLSGLLSPLERQDVLERVANGGIHLLYIAPETLRNPTLTRLLQKRHIARFVIDEAHCFSAWGQDFRVDYLFIAPFIQQLQTDKGLANPIPVSCFTATAKPQVIADIHSYFKQGLGLELEPFISHARRENLAYEVVDLPDHDAKTRQRALLQVLQDSELPAIVYASRTKRVEELATIIQASGMTVRGYHGRMTREDKQANQEAFMKGEVEVMVATKAFGMGVDKEDVRTVVHYNISSSLEEYVQEAGRAGRKAAIDAKCFILYHPNDLSGHFQMLNQSKLNQKEIDQVWRALKNLSKFRDHVSKSALELARAAGWDTEIQDLTNRVTASLAALEHSGYVKRTLNSPRVFASGLLVRDLEQALTVVRDSATLADKQKENCTRVMQRIIKEEETRVDELADQLGMPLKLAMETIQHLRNLKVLNDQRDLTAFVDIRPRAGARSRFERITASERALVDLIPGGTTTMSLRALNQGLIDKGIDGRIDELGDLLRYWKKCRFIRTRREDRLEQTYLIELLKSPEEIRQEIELRQGLALPVLEHLIELADASEDKGSKEERLVLFSLLGMQVVLRGGLFGEEVDVKRIEHALLYLNESKVVRLEDGFMVIYQRLNVERVNKDARKRYTQEDYGHLRLHYQNRVEQIHVVGEYARKRAESAQAALTYVDDYFKLDHKAFVRKYFPKRETEITRPITRERFSALVGDLDTDQTAVVADHSNHILVAAGPGSGKTRVLVHKVANLLLLEDVKPEQFLMLTFSKAAALEFRSRIHALVPEFRGLIKITTFHGLCFELLGQLGDLDKSETVIGRAIDAINGREVDISALANKSVMVLDEFQDVDEHQWRLIQTISNVAEGPRIIAVGDDDQNIYEWRGASPEFMAAFRSLYKATTHSLVTNYRSRASLVALSNHLVKRLRGRIKAGEELTAKEEQPGVQRVVQYTGGYHLCGLVNDLVAQRYPGSTAILTRTNEHALMATVMLQQQGIKARYIGGSDDFELGRLRELRAYQQILRKAHPGVGVIPVETWNRVRDQFLEGLTTNRHRQDFADLIQRFEKEYPGRYDPGEWTDYVRQIRFGDVARTGQDCVFVSTMHKSKGREFTNVFLHLEDHPMDRDDELRLLYVACTRAMQRLVIHTNAAFIPDYNDPALVRESNPIQHPLPERIDYVLGMRDVNLGSCWYGASRINTLRTGAELQTATRTFANGSAPGLGMDGENLLLYAQRFKDGPYAKLQQLGYTPTDASIEYLVHWYNKERDTWHEVVLPRVGLRKSAQGDE